MEKPVQRVYFIAYRKDGSEEVEVVPASFKTQKEALLSDEWHGLKGTTKKIIMIPLDPMSI